MKICNIVVHQALLQDSTPRLLVKMYKIKEFAKQASELLRNETRT